MTRSQFGDWLRERRVAAGMGLNDVARCAGCTASQIACVEDGSTGYPLMKVLAAYCVQCDLPLKEMIKLWAVTFWQPDQMDLIKFAYALEKKRTLKRGPKSLRPERAPVVHRKRLYSEHALCRLLQEGSASRTTTKPEEVTCRNCIDRGGHLERPSKGSVS